MNCCGEEVDQNEIMKSYINPQLNNAGVPNSLTNAFSTGNFSQGFGQLAQTQAINPLAQQLSGGNPFTKALIANQMGSMIGQPQQGGLTGGIVNGIAKKALNSRLG